MSHVYLVQPFAMEFEDWANAVIMAMGGATHNIATPTDNWHHWAESLANSMSVQPLGVPNPNFFDNWLDWANALNSCLGSAGM